jgi:glycosyl transferase family 25
VQTSPGSLGCTLSHIAVLEMAKAQGWPYVLVLEDDFCFLGEAAEVRLRLARAVAVPFDVICLAYVHADRRGFEKVTEDLAHAWFLQTTSGYLVHSRFYDPLLRTFQESLQGLVRTGRAPEFALDRYWFRLQESHKFLCFTPRLGKQAPGFSDIEGRDVDYSRIEPPT